MSEIYNSTDFSNNIKKKMSSNKRGIVLPWFVPGLPLINDGVKTKLSFDIWAWANTRDSMYIFSLPHCNVVSSRGLSIKDPRYTLMQVSKSMWNIQGYANQEKWDSVAMEGRIILESVCAYLNKYRPVQLNSAINEAIRNYPQIEEELNFVRQIGCLGVHFQDNMDSFRIFRTTQKSAYIMIQAVYNLIKKMEDVIYHDYNTEWNETLKKLTNLRNKLSPERLNCKSNVQIKVKSCADEAKPKGCRKKKHLGCPYLHKGDCQFNIEDAKKNLQMLRDYKNTLRDSGLLNDEDNCDSDNSVPSEYDSFTERFNVDEIILCETIVCETEEPKVGVENTSSIKIETIESHINTNMLSNLDIEQNIKDNDNINNDNSINDNNDNNVTNGKNCNEENIPEHQFKDILDLFDYQIRVIITT